MCPCRRCLLVDHMSLRAKLRAMVARGTPPERAVARDILTKRYPTDELTAEDILSEPNAEPDPNEVIEVKWHRGYTTYTFRDGTTETYFQR